MANVLASQAWANISSRGLACIVLKARALEKAGQKVDFSAYLHLSTNTSRINRVGLPLVEETAAGCHNGAAQEQCPHVGRGAGDDVAQSNDGHGKGVEYLQVEDLHEPAG